MSALAAPPTESVSTAELPHEHPHHLAEVIVDILAQLVAANLAVKVDGDLRRAQKINALIPNGKVVQQEKAIIAHLRHHGRCMAHECAGLPSKADFGWAPLAAVTGRVLAEHL